MVDAVNIILTTLQIKHPQPVTAAAGRGSWNRARVYFPGSVVGAARLCTRTTALTASSNNNRTSGAPNKWHTYARFALAVQSVAGGCSAPTHSKPLEGRHNESRNPQILVGTSEPRRKTDIPQPVSDLIVSCLGEVVQAVSQA